ncbi:SDR family oxidoreductase [Hydrocarboniclastica marina]|uniref:SDR family NAD(P)-dependent oxidoreductase n=1 Tax=Hydrocarboniclastica marina TaxID=2259620 RepID=A0A4P7XJP8_9ALTE|nr:SDR family oxidoreductase [Hydrocarboniclastica marina]QCF27003.1 SDR family NAD(P)-dependent oxidoreductase [Hydrocarboniclastica marina]
MVKLKPLRDQVVVITGASSGIGLATARQASRIGARVVATGRNRAALDNLVDEISAGGGEAIRVVGDVCDKADLQRVAEAAIERFGGFDTWINNAGVGLFGPVDAVKEEDHRRLFETNFWGLVNGSLLASAHLRHKGGAIINIGSVASDVTLPNLTMYSASKHAVKGFTDGLRAELEAEGAPVSVTLIKPASIDTPFPQHARNYMNVEPKLPTPIYAVSEVALSICHAAERGGRDLYIGGGARMFGALRNHLPRTVDRFTEEVALKQINSGVSPRDPAGILEHASAEGREHGDMLGGSVRKTSYYARAVRNPGLTKGLFLALGMAAAGALWRHRVRAGGHVGDAGVLSQR